jgi:hypothetical protein
LAVGGLGDQSIHFIYLIVSSDISCSIILLSTEPWERSSVPEFSFRFMFMENPAVSSLLKKIKFKIVIFSKESQGKHF